MKVFISSVVSGMEAYRDAAARAARMLRHEVIRSEDFGAFPITPQRVCLAGVRAADVVLLLLGKRYGAAQASGLSPTHEEFREAKDRCPVLVFVEKTAGREEAQEQFVREAQGWGSGLYTAAFSSPEELQEAVVAGLHQLELAAKTGPIDAAEMISRGRELLAGHGSRGSGLASVNLAVVGAPPQQILRPAELEDPALARELTPSLLFGDVAVFTSEQATRTEISEDRLELSQDDRSIVLDPSGAVLVRLPAEEDRGGRFDLPVLVEEFLLEQIHRGLRLAGWLLDRIDSTHRLQEVAPIVSLSDAGYLGWLTREDVSKRPRSVPVGLGSREGLVVHLHPANRRREALLVDSRRLAEDLTVLLRREKRQ